MFEKIKIILDTDIGDDIDDAFALALAAKSDEVELLGVTTVFKNSRLRGKIAAALLKSLNNDTKIYAGCDFPLIDAPKKFNHDKIDADGLVIPCQFAESMRGENIEEMHAVDFIIDTARKYPKEVVLVPIGPLTNIAMAIRKAPDIVNKIKKIILMGGHLGKQSKKTNIKGVVAEWNIFCDPEAAHIVYTSGIEIYQVGIDVTMQCILTEEDILELKQSNKESSSLLSSLMEKWFTSFKFKNPVMHDPLALATVFNNFCVFEQKNIYVPLAGKDRAKTLITNDELIPSNKIYVTEEVDSKGFLEFFKSRIL